MKKNLDYIAELLEKVDNKQDRQGEALSDIKVTVARSEATFEAHLKQDEQMYSKMEVMDGKLGEYNQQLGIHIDGVKQVRKTNELLEKKLDAHREEVNARLKQLEEPGQIRKILSEKVKRVAKNITYITIIAGACVWALHALARLMQII